MKKIIFLVLAFFAVTAASGQTLQKFFDKYADDERFQYVSINNGLMNMASVLGGVAKEEKKMMSKMQNMKILTLEGDTESSFVKSVFNEGVNFRKMQKGDFIAIQYTQKSYLGKPFGMPEINSAMVQINKKPYYRFKYPKDDKYYDEKGVGFTQSFLFQIPVTFARISSHFTNKRFHPVLKRYRAHLGTDFAAPTGRNIYAAGDGRIEFIGTQGGYGKTVIINHQNGYKTLYAHQNGFSKDIRQGQMIKKGEHIGYVGSTGLSSGPHLHFGMYRNGSAVDPLSILKKPQTDGLEAKEKASFLANTQNIIKRFEKEISNENRTLPNKFERVKDRSEINAI